MKKKKKARSRDMQVELIFKTSVWALTNVFVFMFHYGFETCLYYFHEKFNFNDLKMFCGVIIK